MTDQVVTPEPLTDEQLLAAFPGQDLNHIKTMMGKMDKVSPTAENTDDNSAEDAENAVVYPDYIPEKFRSGTVEEAHQKMAESYKNLESKLGKPPAAVADEPAESNAPQSLSLKDVGEEFLQNDGVISEATYKAFEDKGIARDTLDGYVAGQQAIANQLVTKAYTEAGGEEAYSDMVRWAEKNWSPEEIEAFDAIVGGSSAAAIMVAVRGLKASYHGAMGSDPRLVAGNTAIPGNTAGYQSKAEMTTDMKNPLYKKDPAFRKMVEQKIAKSSIW